MGATARSRAHGRATGSTWRRFLESFSIKDADMERKVSFVVAIAWSFDELGVVLAFTTTLLVGDTLFVVVTVIGPIYRGRWVRDAYR